MRLWHYELIPFLPKSQLLAQWRELNSIFKKQDKHILINYIYEYPLMIDLRVYSEFVIREMDRRGYHYNLTNYLNYFDQMSVPISLWSYRPFAKHHTDRYLLQCFYNLQEKYDRGQTDFGRELYERLERFVFLSAST